jgi:plastocyanin
VNPISSRPRTAAKVLAAAAASLTLALALAGPTLAATSGVSMTEPQPDHYAFTPDATSVSVGDTVTWTNKSDAPHTVTSDSGAFGSPAEQQNQTFSFTFNTPGTFAYHCNIHPYMHGTITVKAANQAASPSASAAAKPSAGGSTGGSSTAGASTGTSSATPAPAPSALPKTGAGGGQDDRAPLWISLGLLALATGSAGFRAFRARR